MPPSQRKERNGERVAQLAKGRQRDIEIWQRPSSSVQHGKEEGVFGRYVPIGRVSVLNA